MFLYKDCSETCDESGCNADFDTVAAKFHSEINQEACYSCVYTESDDGSVEGNKFCMDEPDKIDVSTNCPIYANAGCYIGSNTHASLVTDDLLLEEVYKGCSTFEYDEFNKGKIENVTSSNGNFDINVCKEYCVGKDRNNFHT